MMRNNLLIIVFLIAAVNLKAQKKDSVTNANKVRIEELKKRILALESPAPSVEDLQKLLKQKNDSIALLVEQLKGCKKNTSYSVNLNADANNALVNKHLNNCSCLRLFYKLDQTKLNFEEYKALDSVATICASNSNYKLNLSGHADKTGDENYNKIISKKRVEELKAYLLKSTKIQESQIILEWHGSAIPSEDAMDDSKQFLNRRTEIKLIGN